MHMRLFEEEGEGEDRGCSGIVEMQIFGVREMVLSCVRVCVYVCMYAN